VTAEIADLPPEGLGLVGVALAGDSEGGATTWGLNLVFTAAGITVQHPQSRAESLLAWSELDATRCAERLVLPDGRNAAVLELISNGLSLRFFLPVDTVAPGQAAYLDLALPDWLARYKSPPVVVPAPVTPPPPPPVVVRTAVSSGTVGSHGTVAATGLLGGDITSPGPDLPGAGPATPVGAVTWDAFAPHERSPVSAPPDPTDGGVDPTSVGEAGERPAGQGRRTWVLLIVLLVAVVVIGATVYLVKKHDDSGGPSASALAASINVRTSDLPAGWGVTSAAASAPPAALPSARMKAAQTLATCIGQPSALVEAWFGTTEFPGQLAAVTSRTFEGGSSPTVQIFSTTKVMQPPAEGRSPARPFAVPNFATCFGQYQVAAVAVPITAQVQAVALSAPAGVEVSCYVTTFTLSNHRSEVVQDAFIVHGSTATVLQASAAGLSVPSADVQPAYDAVVRRVATAGT
jgi:hypothetical protein